MARNWTTKRPCIDESVDLRHLKSSSSEITLKTPFHPVCPRRSRYGSSFHVDRSSAVSLRQIFLLIHSATVMEVTNYLPSASPRSRCGSVAGIHHRGWQQKHPQHATSGIERAGKSHRLHQRRADTTR